MKGFCSGSSIEISLELNEDEISKLERETINEKIRRGHDNPQRFVDVSLKLGTAKCDSLMALKVVPSGADFENTVGYEITLSVLGYKNLKKDCGVVDRPELGTKVSVYKK